MTPCPSGQTCQTTAPIVRTGVWGNNKSTTTNGSFLDTGKVASNTTVKDMYVAGDYQMAANNALNFDRLVMYYQDQADKQSTQTMGGTISLDNTTITITNIDVSKVLPGVVATMYATTLPGPGAQISGGAVSPKDQHALFATYCDAQGSLSWDGQKDDVIAPSTTQTGSGSQYQACPEFDFFEANQDGINITSHPCGYDTKKQTFGNTFSPFKKSSNAPGTTTCNWSGNAITSLAPPGGQPDGVANHMQLKPLSSEHVQPTDVYFGMGKYIDSSKPFDLSIKFDTTANEFTATVTQIVSQTTNTITATQSLGGESWLSNVTLPWTVMYSMWGGKTSWLDGHNANPATQPPTCITGTDALQKEITKEAQSWGSGPTPSASALRGCSFDGACPQGTKFLTSPTTAFCSDPDKCAAATTSGGCGGTVCKSAQPCVKNSAVVSTVKSFSWKKN